MNERIKEFRFKAAEYANEQKPLGITKWNEVRDAKFAELIVKECLEACSRAYEIRHFVPPSQEQVVLSCMREIETTFRS